jgi:hypothetical protein
MRHAFPVLPLLALLAVTGCKVPEAPTVAHLDVDFSWNDTVRCTTAPPAFTIGGVPPGTKTLDFTMRLGGPTGTMLGGGHVPYTGSPQVPAGAFGYLGPCPMGVQNYNFTVQALDSTGTIIARGDATRQYPP